MPFYYCFVVARHSFIPDHSTTLTGLIRKKIIESIHTQQNKKIKMPPFDYVKARSQDSLDSTSPSLPSEQQQQQRQQPPPPQIDTTGATTTPAIPCCFVDGYPYLWRYRVDWKDNQSIKDVCVQMFGQIVLAQSSSSAAAAEASGDAETTSSGNMLMMNDTTSYDASLLHVQRISGGVTNMLFKVSGLRGIFKNIIPIINVPNSEDAKTATTFAVVPPNDVLVRIFGAEGMINRDDETYYFSVLARQGIAPPYFGRFQNGRLEGWMDDMRPLETSDLHCNDYNDENDNNSTGSTAAASTNVMIQAGIARALAQLHATNVPTIHHPSTAASSLDETAPQQHQNNQKNKEPTLWKQLEEWYQQACSNAAYKTTKDEQRARELNLANYRAELDWLRYDIVEQSATPLRVAFCHNDLLAANILYKNSDGNCSRISSANTVSGCKHVTSIN